MLLWDLKISLYDFQGIESIFSGNKIETGEVLLNINMCCVTKYASII